MLALPAAPTPPRPRMLFVATALVVAAVSMAFALMLGVYLHFRDVAGGTTAAWLPDNVEVPGIPANIMLICFVVASVMVQWALYAIARADRTNAAIALGLTVITGLLIINAQVVIYERMELGIRDGSYQMLFYAITGAFLLALVGGIVFAAVTAFRSLGGRYTAKRHETFSALALYWHSLAVLFFAVWYVVYVLK